MRKVLSCCPGCAAEKIAQAGFDGAEAELKAGGKVSAPARAGQTNVVILRIQGRELALPGGRELLREALAYVSGRRDGALIIDTFDLEDEEELGAFFIRNMDAVREAGRPLGIENGCLFRSGRYFRNGLAEGERLRSFSQRLNLAGGDGLFRGAVNTGRANLLGLNAAEMIRILGDGLLAVRFEDNDGRENYEQLPGSFTSGRGEPTTDWPGIIRALAEIEFSGTGIMHVPGFLSCLPEALLPDMLHFLYRMMEEWEKQIGFGKRLAKAKQIILFGCGIRFQNYMEAWGRAHPPAFIADNNRALWGTEREGIPVRSPESILEVPGEDRLVLICNQYFIEIGKQLRDMGVSYEIYDDAYWGRFHIQQNGKRGW